MQKLNNSVEGWDRQLNNRINLYEIEKEGRKAQ